MKRNLQRWLFWLGLAISAIFLFLAFRKINYQALWATLTETRLWWLIPGLAIYFTSMWMRTWRWQYLLNPIKKVSAGVLFPIIFIGYMGNNVFPLRMGEILRTVVLKRREDVAISASLATIVVERIFDAVVIVGFVLLNLSQLTALPGTESILQLGSLATWAALVFALGLIVFILVAIFPKTTMRILHSLFNKLLPKPWRQPVMDITDRFLEGLMSLRSPKDALMILITSILVWLLETGLYWSVNRAFGLDLNLGQLMLLNGAVNMVLLIPAAPGGLGTFDAAGRAMLQAFGIAAEPALGYTLVLRIALWVPVTLVGAAYFLREGLKWTLNVNEIQQQAEDAEAIQTKGNQNDS